MEQIRHTKAGRWLQEKAPNILNTVGNLLPDKGVLGILKNLVDADPNFSEGEKEAFNSHLKELEIARQENVTKRWESDMKSDVKLAKLIRPLTLLALMAMFMLTMVFDSIDTLAFNVKDSYVSLLEILMLTAFGAYFAGRTIEKVKK